MTKKIKINEIGKFFGEEYDEVISLAVLNLDFRLKQASPVDTGRFRGNWQVAQNSKKAPIISGPHTNQKSVNIPLQKINYTKEKRGNTYTLINPLPYAEAVCYGTNTPPSWGKGYPVKEKSGNQKGWPNLQVAETVKFIKKLKSKN